MRLLADQFTFQPARDYDLEHSTPQAFLGYEIGARYTPHQRLVEYCQSVAEKLRVTVKTYARPTRAAAVVARGVERAKRRAWTRSRCTCASSPIRASP
ncbi:MAG: hypothetical protein U1E76_23985 [Planctomycetota bacterium]